MATGKTTAMACYIGGSIDDRYRDQDTCQINGGDWLPRDGRVPGWYCRIDGRVRLDVNRRECLELGGEWIRREREPLRGDVGRRKARKTSRKSTKRRKKPGAKGARMRATRIKIRARSRARTAKKRKTRPR
jgi:hypothetical protein